MKITKDIYADELKSTNDDTAEGSNKKHTLVHEILQSDLPPTDKTLEHLYDDMVTISSAGFETTAHVMRAVLYYVYKNPDILNRLREELDAASQDSTGLEKGKPNLTALEQLPYLTGALMEGLRLGMPVSSRLARVAPDRELVYNDKWHIPPGTPVGMTMLLLNRNEDLYPDHKRFLPERWMGPTVRKNADKTFAPFNRGTRSCLGQQ